MYSAIYSYRILVKLEYYRQAFEKYSNIRFRENPSSGSQVVPCGQADGQTHVHDEGNSRFSEFFERAKKKPKCFSMQFCLFSERALLVGRLPGFAHFYIFLPSSKHTPSRLYKPGS